MFVAASWLSALPLMYFTWSRLRSPGNYDLYCKQLPASGWMDYCMKAVAIFYTTYYVADSVTLCCLLYNDFQICDLAFLSHHIVSIAGAPFVLSFPHYPWFVIGPLGFHCFLVMFPYQTWLNYIYLLFLLSSVVGLQTKPWYNYTRFRGLLYCGYVLTAGPIVMLWLFDCKNNMDNTAVLA
jgi:hypothetical protein